MTDKVDMNQIEETITEILEQYPGKWGACEYHDFLCGETGDEDHGGRLQCIYQEGGGEGSGEHVESVFMLDGKYYKATWSYYSQYGYEWDNLGMTQVFPKEKTIIVFE